LAISATIIGDSAMREPAYVQFAFCEGGIIGGHVSSGIGDYSSPEREYPSNAKLVEFFANLARAYGREVASLRGDPLHARSFQGTQMQYYDRLDCGA
jgi:hypothetical protein